jgi:hypothetical protein
MIKHHIILPHTPPATGLMMELVVFRHGAFAQKEGVAYIGNDVALVIEFSVHQQSTRLDS